MEKSNEKNVSLHKPWKKVLCFILSVIIAFGTFVTFTFGNSRFQKWLGINSVLSAYASDIVDTKGAAAIDEESMLADDHSINLENRDGTNTVYLFSEPISYTDENGKLKTKDISVEKSDKELENSGYEYTNGQNDYRINFSKDYNIGVQAEFDDCAYSIIPISDSDTVGDETVAQYLSEKFEAFEYKDIYGSGTNLRFYPQLNGIKDEIVLNNDINKYDFSFRIETENCTARLDEDSTVVLADSDNNIVQTFSKPFAYDSDFIQGIYDEHYIDCQYTLEEISDGVYTLTVSVDENWLKSDSTVYPVVIDPTTGNSVFTEDAGIYTGMPNNNYGSEQTGCMGLDRGYGYGRVLTYFPMPSSINKGAVINSAYSWQRETTGATTTSYIRPYILVSGWMENSVTWNNRPSYRTAVEMPRKLVNSASTDKSGNPYWYRFDITAAVQAWTDGSYHNYGVMFISSDDLNNTYDWRAFASRSYNTSAMRPYYVINYTNDLIAPTVTSVTGNTTEWTNGNVTLTVNGAKDNTGGIGMHTASYSFSTTPGEYDWRIANSLTFTSNCTVYICVRDAWDNKRLVSTQVIDKIDKTAPSVPEVTGNSTDWTADTVTLTASSDDAESGIKDYSFSTTQGVYSWQTQNTKTFDSNTTVYVYARDNAGNISEPKEIDLKIDKSLPTGTVNFNVSTNWVKQVIISADATDELSGLNESPYSFSTKEGEYEWQKKNTKTITSNGTYYIYARDYAGNIVLLDTVTIDKIDNSAPEITDINIEDIGENTIITISAQDNQSGILAYSIDDGRTWQESNVFEVPKGSINFVAAKVKDKVDNYERYSEYKDIILPEIYYENDKVGIYNPNPNMDYYDCFKYYCIDKPTCANDWKDYEEPFVVPEDCDEIYVSFYPANDVSDIKAVPINKNNHNYFEYTERNTDLSLSYKGVSFNIDRQYKGNEWHYSVESNLTHQNDFVIDIMLPDFNNYSFVKRNKYLYFSESVYSSISVVYDNTDTYITEYICKYNGVNYHYNTAGKLYKISNSNGDLYNITRNENSIIIQDYADRVTVMEYDNGKPVALTDASGGDIEYIYDDNNLIKVIDQAGVIQNEYVYDNDVLIKSGYNNILRDNANRVVKIIADNGSYTQYEYQPDKVVLSSSDVLTSGIEYNYYGNIVKYIDDNGDTVENIYSDSNKLSEVYKNGEWQESIYYYEGRLDGKTNNTGSFLYEYNESDKVYCVVDCKFTDSEKVSFVHYAYDDLGNVIVKAEKTVPHNEFNYNFINYDSKYNYDSVTKYEYTNGLVSKVIESNSISVNTYDEYSNLIKTAITVTEDDVTTVSVSESEYDILGRLLTSVSDNSVISYTYDAAGRVLLTNTDGSYKRNVYDNRGRIVQEIGNDYYNSEIDDLPADYPDSSVGIRYTYDNMGNLIKEINESDIEINYQYSSTGCLYKKSFDIYEYYYQNDGDCDRIDVDGSTAVDYDYKVDDSDISVSDGKYINRVTYADGTVKETVYDKNDNLISIYKNGSIIYGVLSSNENGFSTFENELYQTCTMSSSADTLSYSKKWYSNNCVYNVTSHDDVKTIQENRFGLALNTILQEDTAKYSYSNYEFDYCFSGDENISSQVIKSNAIDVLSSNITFNEETNSFSKTYDSLGLNFTVQYDEQGNVISDENNSYTYNESGEILSSSGSVNSSYTYDGKGNLLSKTNGGTHTVFSYDNKNRLTTVNDTVLTYNASGNLLSYGNSSYYWSDNQRLSNYSDGTNNYSYKYDSSDVRTSKYSNGVTTEFYTVNGRILAQKDNNNCIHFLYYEDTPIGFILNNVQYFYVTNLTGDIVGITDAGGNLIARYSYDEWGKLLSIEPAEEDNEEQLSIAQLNPLRYRGYYYDTESGLYYINSRYYSPELCRFISCGDYSSIDYSNKYGLNAYSYCYNSPAAFSNYDGTYKSSVDTAEIKQFLKNSIKVIKTLSDEFAKALEIDKESIKKKVNQILDKTKKFFDNMISRYNTFIDKLEYAINYPDAVINDAFSKIFNKDVNIRFKIIENIRANSNLNIDLSNFKFKMDENSGSSTLMKKAKGYVTEAGKTVGAVIVEIFTCLDLQEIAKELGKTFSFNNFEDYMQQKANLYTEWFDKVNISTKIIDRVNKGANYISWFSTYIPEPTTKIIVTVLPFFTSAVKDFSGKYISTKGSAIMLGYDWLIYSAGLLGAVGGSGGKKFGEFFLNMVFSKFFDKFALDNAEYYAYNWYLMEGKLI